jgi:HSP20 family molecular chaperone IbpA
MALHRNSDVETVTMTIELPTLEQRDVNVEAHGKHLSLFLDFERSENHDKG